MRLGEIYKNILDISSKNYISEPLIVGGIPRDIYLKRADNTDIDLTTNDSDSPRLGITLALDSKLGFKMFEDGHVSVYTESRSLDFSGNFISKKAVEYSEYKHSISDENLQEVVSRDFTINTLHKRLFEDSLIDFTGLAIKDLDNRIIRTISSPDICFEDDVRRIFRAINFSARFGFSISGDIVDYVNENLDYVSKEMGRSLRDAFVTSIISESLTADSDRTLGYLSDMGVLPLIPLVGLFKEELIKRRMVARYLDDTKKFEEIAS